MERDADGKIQQMASALFLRRLAAYSVDMALCFVLLYLLERWMGDREMFASERADITKNILFSLYMFLALLLCRGQSLGKRLAGLCVVSEDGARAGAFRLIYREFLGRFLLEKSNLILCYTLNTTGALEALRASITHPLLDTVVVALVSLPWLTFVSFAFALCRPDGRVLHDVVSGTLVMRA